MRLPDGPESRYLAETVGVPLQHALADVCVMRPRDPIEFLAQCLYRFADSVERDRQEEEAKAALRKEETDELLASQHLAVISHEDDVIRNEQERRKRIYLDREREVEILISPRSSRSRKSSMSDDLGASSTFGASGGTRQLASSNPNALSVPGPVPPLVEQRSGGVTNEGKDRDTRATDANLKTSPAEKSQESSAAGKPSEQTTPKNSSEATSAGVKADAEGKNSDANDTEPSEGAEKADAEAKLPVADPVNETAGQATGSNSESQPTHNNENDDTKVATSSAVNETPQDTEVAGDSSEQESELKRIPAETVENVVTTPAATTGETSQEVDPGLYTIGEQEED